MKSPERRFVAVCYRLRRGEHTAENFADLEAAGRALIAAEPGKREFVARRIRELLTQGDKLYGHGTAHPLETIH